MSEREHHIKVLEQFLHDYQEWGEDLELKNTIKYAISSLITDKAYQIMYEGGEIFTQDEVIDMLEKLKTVIESQPNYMMAVTDSSGLICYGYSEREPSAKDAVKHIQAKINALRGEEE